MYKLMKYTYNLFFNLWLTTFALLLYLFHTLPLYIRCFSPLSDCFAFAASVGPLGPVHQDPFLSLYLLAHFAHTFFGKILPWFCWPLRYRATRTRTYFLCHDSLFNARTYWHFTGTSFLLLSLCVSALYGPFTICLCLCCNGICIFGRDGLLVKGQHRRLWRQRW